MTPNVQRKLAWLEELHKGEWAILEGKIVANTKAKKWMQQSLKKAGSLNPPSRVESLCQNHSISPPLSCRQ